MSFLINPYRFAAAAATDPDFSSVSLLLHGNASPLVDSSGTPKTITAFGNAAYSTAQGKFGSGSIAFDGNGDYLTTPANTGFVLNGDFTIEAWVYSQDATAFLGIYTNNSDGQWNSRGNGLHIDTGRIEITGVGSISYPSGSLALNTWTHVALCRSGSTVTFYRNGASEITATSSLTFGDGTNVPGVGLLDSLSGTPRFFFKGHIDDLRITKGVARYTANFTPPTAPFPDS